MYGTVICINSFICLVSSNYSPILYLYLGTNFYYRVEKLVGDREFRDIDTNTFNLKDYMSIFSKLILNLGIFRVYLQLVGMEGFQLLYARRDDFEEEEYISTERRKDSGRDSIMDVRVEKIEKMKIGEEEGEINE